MNSLWRWLTTFILILCVVPADAFAEPPDSDPLSLRLLPEEIVLKTLDQSHRVLLIGDFSDGLARDLTSSCELTIAEPRVAEADSRGRVKALAQGETELIARFRGQEARIPVRVVSNRRSSSVDFRQIESILTKRGCNASECHAGVKGRGGFKLSLNALHPKQDYRWTVEGGTYQVLKEDPLPPINPRIDLNNPEKSLLLLKPTLAVSHMGGLRLEPDSNDYRTVLNWIRQGAPFEDPTGERVMVEEVQVFPSEAVLLPEAGAHQLLVTARLSDGSWQDITGEARYESGNPDVVEVNPDGLVIAVKPGETAVIIRTAGHVVSARFGVVDRLIEEFPEIEPVNLVDRHTFRKLRKFHILPSHVSTDEEFLRRVCLDVTGTLPPPDRVGEFLADKDPAKREKLIDILLNTPEYVDYWTFRLADLFRISLYSAGSNPKFSQSYSEWLRGSVAANKPYDQIARERIAAQGYGGAAPHYLPILQPPLPEDAAGEQVRVFLGRRMDCAQCHDHPFEEWSQNQFWGMAAFFQRLTFYWFMDVGTQAVVLDDAEGYSRRDNMGKVIHPRSGKQVEPAFLDGTGLAPEERQDPRMALAEWMTSHPYFATTAVNRLWSYFFGRGLVDPVDDFRSSNPPTHPELLHELARDFRENGYDLKRLIRTIVQSRAYQLSSVPNESNREDRLNYSHRLPRPLDAEVLLDAISQVTGIPETFMNQRGGQAPAGTRAIQLDEPDLYPSRFLEIYGRPLRQMLPQRNPSPNLGQALHRLAGDTYTDRLAQSGGRLHSLLESGASDLEIIRKLYVAALSRLPTMAEEAALESFVRVGASRKTALEDVLWALINSHEFTHNH